MWGVALPLSFFLIIYIILPITQVFPVNNKHFNNNTLHFIDSKT